MSKTEKLENLVEGFASAINSVRLPSVGFFGVEVASHHLTTAFSDLIGSGAKVSILIKAGEEYQYFGFQLDRDLVVQNEFVLGDNFALVPESLINRQMQQLKQVNPELFAAVVETNIQRFEQVKSLAVAIKDCCEPYKALSRADDPTYPTLQENIRFVSEVYGQIYISAKTEEAHIVLEFQEDLENAEMTTYY